MHFVHSRFSNQHSLMILQCKLMTLRDKFCYPRKSQSSLLRPRNPCQNWAGHFAQASIGVNGSALCVPLEKDSHIIICLQYCIILFGKPYSYSSFLSKGRTRISVYLLSRWQIRLVPQSKVKREIWQLAKSPRSIDLANGGKYGEQPYFSYSLSLL